jgi:hypothetical protein
VFVGGIQLSKGRTGTQRKPTNMEGERMPPSVQALLLCPISFDVMEDPVLLLPAGMTYDCKQICASILYHPNLDPASGVRYDCKLQYCDNVAVRQLLMETYGDKAYRKYDDSIFQTRYQEARIAGKFGGRVTARNSNVEVYGRVSQLLWGMNLSQTNPKAALELVEMFPGDAVMVALCSWVLKLLIRNLTFARILVWRGAHGIVHWALVYKRRLLQATRGLNGRKGADIFSQNYVDTVEWIRKAAEQCFAAAQCYLGVMYAMVWEWPRAPVLLSSGTAKLLCKDMLLPNSISGSIIRTVWEWRRATVLLSSGTAWPRSRIIRQVKLILHIFIQEETEWPKATVSL